MNKSDSFNARRSVALAALKLANRLPELGFRGNLDEWERFIGCADEAVALIAMMPARFAFCPKRAYTFTSEASSDLRTLNCFRSQAIPKPKRHNAKLCPFAIRQRIINALANSNSVRAIARAFHVSNDPVAVIREQQWQQVAARKERIAAQCELNATLAAERMTDKLRGNDDISLNTLVPAFGVSVDKLAILRGDASVNIANIVLPTEEERAERRALHDKLDEIARGLAKAPAHTGE